MQLIFPFHCLFAFAILGTSAASLGQEKPIRVPSATEPIAAGPFSIRVPAPLHAGAIIEKVPLRKNFTPEELRRTTGHPSSPPKPAYLDRPEHWAVRFPALALPGTKFDAEDAGSDSSAPQVLIHKADEWGIAGLNGIHPATVPATFRKLRHSLEIWGKTNPSYPGPAYIGSLSFTCLKKKIQFRGGYGYRAITQEMMEADLVRRERLKYLFIGLSDDNSCQIIATFPLDCPGLPDDSPEAAHLGFSTRNYQRLTDLFDVYEPAAKAWLVRRADRFTPSLATLDAMIESIDARTWKR